MLRNEKKQNGLTEFNRDLVTASMASLLIAYTTFPVKAFKKYQQAEQKARGIPFKPFRGSTPFVANIVPTSAIQLATKGVLSQCLPENANFLQQLIASGFCGVTGAITATPVENSIVRQQVMQAGAMPTIKDMLQHGYLRPWKTFYLIAARDAIFAMLMLSVLPSLGTYAQKNNLDARYYWFANIASTAVFTALSHPFDTVATNLQMTHERKSSITVAKTLYKKEGMLAFSRGFNARLFLVFAFANGIPPLKQAGDHYLYGRCEKPSFFKWATGDSKGVEKESSPVEEKINPVRKW